MIVVNEGKMINNYFLQVNNRFGTNKNSTVDNKNGTEGTCTFKVISLTKLMKND